tara:strand:+ start:3183 stop:4325 length:1143 start_codon:yes stop_codon:yes gene_type:complete
MKKLSRKKIQKIIKVLYKKISFKKRSSLRVDIAYIVYALAALIFLLAILLFVWFNQSRFITGEKEDYAIDVLVEHLHVNEEESCEIRQVISGICAEKEEDIHKEFVAVVVENHIDALPLSGIQDASIIYEFPVESDIPRLLAIFPVDMDVEKVGPVRSARPYFLDTLYEYGNPMFMHVGGSPESLLRIKDESLFSVNEFFRSWYFWRSKKRYAPHNTYTSSKLWQGAYERYGKEQDLGTITPWKFKTAQPCESECITFIDFDYFYKHEWHYSSNTNRYVREQFRRPYIDDKTEQVFADTIIVQYVETRVLDAVGRLRLDLLGSGKALVFMGGKAVDATWKRDSLRSRTQWLDTFGEEILLNPGKIWIEVVSRTKGGVLYQ